MGEAGGFGFGLGLTQKFTGFSSLVYFGFKSRKSCLKSKILGQVLVRFQIGSVFPRSSHHWLDHVKKCPVPTLCNTILLQRAKNHCLSSHTFFLTKLFKHIREMFLISIGSESSNFSFQLSLYFYYKVFKRIKYLVAVR